jgi:hypothetical protein
MRAKKLEVFKAPNNPAMGAGANSIVYNLAFSPKIKFIDLSQLQGTNDDTAEAFMKLITISGGLETLILRHSTVIPQLKQEFFNAVGINKTIRYINLDSISAGNGLDANKIARACAFNAKKGCALRAVSMKMWLSNAAAFTNFMTSFKVSDKDEELLYGDKKTADEMKTTQLEKKFHCKLEYLDFDSSILKELGTGFKPKTIVKATTPDWPVFLHFMTLLPFEVNMRNC